MMNRFFTLLLAASCLTAVGQVPDYVPTDGLVAWYALDGDANDFSGFSNHGAINGAQMTENRFGEANGAFSFSGGTNIQIPHNSQIDFATGDSLTWAIWVLCHPDEVGSVFEKWLNSFVPYPPFHIRVNAVQGGAQVSSSGYCGQDGQSAVVSSVIPWNTWTHVAFTSSASHFNYFIDGQLVMSAEIPQVGCSNDHPLTIGTRAGATHAHYEGRVDDFGIWDRTLSPEEIVALHLLSSPIEGCTDANACNYNSEANMDDDSCLYPPHETLRSLVELSSSSELQVSVPQGLSSWSWSDGVQDSTRTIQPFQEYVLNGFVGQIPELGEEFEGGVVFAIDTMAQTAFLATNEPVGSGSEWGCKTTTTGATSTAFGAGQTNTQIILDACQDSDCAARIAASVGPDWYLPSRDELEAIRVRLHNDGLASYSMNNTYNWYWSSTECLTDGTAATDIHFSDGFVGECNNKDSNPGGVIAVKNSPINFCSYTDTLRIELDGDPLCGIGTVWDDISQTCIVANPSDSNFDGCVQLNDLLDLLSAYGDCGSQGSAWQCGDPLEYQGYDYETVQIGEQCWFAENLRAENYRNGEAIPADLSDSEWTSTTSGAVAVYGEDTGCQNFSPDIDACDPSHSLEEYGRLYNWHAVDDARSLCPNAWHVPTDGEWTVMTDELGGESIAGGQMKTTYGWYQGGNGTNSIGFSGLPGGNRYFSGAFNDAGKDGDWWSSTPNESSAWYRGVDVDGEDVNRSNNYQRFGFSVRCIKDTQ